MRLLLTHGYFLAQDRLVTSGDWRDRSDLDFRISGRHPRNFYQHADELLCEETTQLDAIRIEAIRADFLVAAAEVEA